MLRAYKYRIYPTKYQQDLIEKTFNCCRLVYNLALQVKIEAYKRARINLSAYDLQLQLTELKLYYQWLKEVDSQALQSSIKKIDAAFKSFFLGSGYPKFKNKNGHQSFQCTQNVRRVNFEKQLLSIPKIPNIPIKINRIFIGEIRTITISRNPAGKYFASILVITKETVPNKIQYSEETTVGIDLGIKTFAILSTGEKISNPKYYSNNLKRLKCLQRRLSQKKKGSNNRKKAAKAVAIQHERIVNMRQDFLHKLSTRLVSDNQAVCVEDLAVKNMVRNRKLSQAIAEVGWSEFVRQLKYKCEWGGKHFIQIGRFEPTSKTCSNCGLINSTLTLKDREWTCQSCGVLHDRDINAAINIRNSGMGNAGEPVELSALAETMKQEDII